MKCSLDHTFNAAISLGLFLDILLWSAHLSVAVAVLSDLMLVMTNLDCSILMLWFNVCLNHMTNDESELVAARKLQASWSKVNHEMSIKSN